VKKGKLFVLSAPSGGGKTTIRTAILQTDPSVVYSVSVTTRPMRPGEVDGKDYHFVTPEIFDSYLKNGEFLESAEVHGNNYGTRRKYIEEATSSGKNVIMDIDVQGALNIKRLMPESVLIFLIPPSLEELEKRLRGRNTDSEEIIDRRLTNAISELSFQNRYDYVVVNDYFPTCLEEIKKIISHESQR